MRLIRPFTGTGAIFFPVGLPPNGTCFFATKSCLKLCYAVNPIDIDYDEDLRIPQDEKWEIYDYTMTTKKETLVDKILQELNGLQTPILHWFGTGDCLPKDTERISELVNLFKRNKIVQMGFTRNKRLWREHKDIFAFSIEAKKDTPDKEGIYSIPNYGTQVSVMHSPQYKIKGGYCGPLTCKDVNGELEHYINCKSCLRLKAGCFDRR